MESWPPKHQDICNAIKATNNAKSDIAKILDFFNLELTKESNNVKWDTAGSLTEVKRQLIETLSFMSGFTVKEIENTLLEDK